MDGLRQLKTSPGIRSRQRGVAMPLVAVGLIAMLAIVGLAVDASHALANKTRLQNTVDAAALAAAKVYDQTEDIADGDAAALSLFGLNADGQGNQELNAAYDAGDITVVVQWSETLDPFVSSGVGPYVRVIASNFSIAASLTAVLGVTDLDMRASAVSGPSPTINSACNIAPMVVCAEDPDDPDLFGFEANQLEVLKSAAGSNPGGIGPGNFQLIRINCPGGACVRENMAGSYDGCVNGGQTVETEPGNTVGPSVQGINTRLGIYQGPVSPDDYPPDVVVDEPNPRVTYDEDTDTIEQNNAPVDDQSIDFGFDQYQAAVNAGNFDNPPPDGVFERRVLILPVAECTGGAGGQTTLQVVGFGCYFLLQRAVQKGNEAEIFGQFIEGCNAGGMPGPAPVSGPGPYRIQLYKDPDSQDS